MDNVEWERLTQNFLALLHHGEDAAIALDNCRYHVEEALRRLAVDDISSAVTCLKDAMNESELSEQ